MGGGGNSASDLVSEAAREMSKDEKKPEPFAGLPRRALFVDVADAGQSPAQAALPDARKMIAATAKKKAAARRGRGRKKDEPK